MMQFIISTVVFVSSLVTHGIKDDSSKVLTTVTLKTNQNELTTHAQFMVESSLLTSKLFITFNPENTVSFQRKINGSESFNNHTLKL